MKSSGKRMLATMFVVLILQLACSVGSNTPMRKFGSEVGFAPVPTDFSTTSVYQSYTAIGSVNVRSCSSTTCTVTNVLSPGQVVEAVCGSGNWCEIRDPDGYVYAPCLSQGSGVCR